VTTGIGAVINTAFALMHEGRSIRSVVVD
jgi:hypothetical protein